MRMALFLILLIPLACDQPTTGPLPTADPGSQALQSIPTRLTFLVDPGQLWEHIQVADSTVTLGVKHPGQGRGVWDGQWLQKTAHFQQSLAVVRRTSGVEVLKESSGLPAILLKVENQSALERILSLPFVDYVEPANVEGGYNYAPKLAGSTDGAETGPVAALDLSGQNYGGYSDDQGNLIPNIYTGMRIEDAWDLSTGAGVNIASLDTGVDTRNPDLNHWDSYLVSTGDNVYDSNGHGTHQAGTIAAKKDGYHTVGVAYDANPIAVKHSNGPVWNHINTWRIVAALDTAVAHGAEVVNMAFYSEHSNLISDAISRYYAGNRLDGTRFDVLFTAAAGSGGAVGDYWFNVVFPARHNDVIAVSAIDYDTNDLYSMSHSGSQVEMSAYHGMPTSGTQDEGYTNGESSNTSNASAIVAGIAALVRAQYPTEPNTTVRTRLRRGARDLPPYGGMRNMAMESSMPMRPSEGSTLRPLKGIYGT